MNKIKKASTTVVCFCELMCYFAPMSAIEKITKGYVYSNLHVSLAAYSTVRMTGFFLGFDTKNSALFVGLSCLVSYNFIRWVTIKKEGNSRPEKRWFQKHFKRLIFFNMLALAVLVYLLRGLPWQSILALFPFFIIALLYELPLIKWSGRRSSLRSVPGLKIFCIAFTWSGVAVLFSLLAAKQPLRHTHFLFFFQQFLLVTVWTLPFDLRDLKHDPIELRTIPQVLGVKNTKITGGVLLILYGLISCYTVPFSRFGMVFLLLFFLGIFLIFSKRDQSVCYTTLWGEGIPVFWFVSKIVIDHFA